MRSEKACLERLRLIDENISALHKEAINVKKKLVKLRSKKTFKFPGLDKPVPYSDITLICVNHFRRGLGYDEDRYNFSEYRFYYEPENMMVRFYGKNIMDKFGIPYSVITQYGRTCYPQTEYGEEASLFRGKFRDVCTCEHESLRSEFPNHSLHLLE